MNQSHTFKVESLTKKFGGAGKNGNVVKAVNNVSFQLESGKIYGIIGRSGSGKTTLMRMLLKLIPPAAGSIYFNGRDITGMSDKELKVYFRPLVRAIFQHPEAALNPAYTIAKILRQPLRMYGENRLPSKLDERVREVLLEVGLSPDYLKKQPHQLSGGEKKRVSICRALINKPAFLFADEPFAGLDATLQWNLRDIFKKISREYGAGVVIISHDLHIIKPMSDQILVMDNGSIIDQQQPDKNGEYHFSHPFAKEMNASLHLAKQ